MRFTRKTLKKVNRGLKRVVSLLDQAFTESSEKRLTPPIGSRSHYVEQPTPPATTGWPREVPKPVTEDWQTEEIPEPLTFQAHTMQQSVALEPLTFTDGDMNLEVSEQWNDEEIPEPPIGSIVVDVKITTDDHGATISQRLEVESSQPVDVEMRVEVQTRTASADAEKQGRIKSNLDKYAQHYADVGLVGIQPRELAAIMDTIDTFSEVAVIDLLNAELPHSRQIGIYKGLCRMCDAHGISYGRTSPYSSSEYNLAIISLTRLLRRRGVAVPWVMSRGAATAAIQLL